MIIKCGYRKKRGTRKREGLAKLEMQRLEKLIIQLTLVEQALILAILIIIVELAIKQ